MHVAGPALQLPGQSLVHELAQRLAGQFQLVAAGHHPGAFPWAVVGQIDESLGKKAAIAPLRLETAKDRGNAPVPALVPDRDLRPGLRGGVVDQELVFLQPHLAAHHLLDNRQQDRVQGRVQQVRVVPGAAREHGEGRGLGVPVVFVRAISIVVHLVG